VDGNPRTKKLSDTDASELRRRAEQGDTVAQIELGRFYWDEWDERYGWAAQHCGENFELLDEAAKWLGRACEQNNSRACMMLCELEIDRMDGLPAHNDMGADKEEVALRWYARARELGHPHDLTLLGLRLPTPDKFIGPVYSEEDTKYWDLQYAKAGDLKDQWHAACGADDSITAYAWSYVTANSPRRHPVFENTIWQERSQAAAVCRRLETVFGKDEMEKARRMACLFLDEYGDRHVFKVWRAGTAHWIFDSRHAIEQRCYWYLVLQLFLLPVICGSELIDVWRYRRSKK
jgi:hypothetical protein